MMGCIDCYCMQSFANCVSGGSVSLCRISRASTGIHSGVKACPDRHVADRSAETWTQVYTADFPWCILVMTANADAFQRATKDTNCSLRLMIRDAAATDLQPAAIAGSTFGRHSCHTRASRFVHTLLATVTYFLVWLSVHPRTKIPIYKESIHTFLYDHSYRSTALTIVLESNTSALQPTASASHTLCKIYSNLLVRDP